jgi:hypothetical protein
MSYEISATERLAQNLVLGTFATVVGTLCVVQPGEQAAPVHQSVVTIERPATSSIATPNSSDTQSLAPGSYCPAPTPTSLRIAESLLEGPGFNSIKPAPGYASPYDAVDATEAKKLGLTIFAMPADSDMLFEQLESSHPPTFETMLKKANTFMNKLGVEVSVDTPHDAGDAAGSRAPTQQELEQPIPKMDLFEVMEAYQNVPIKYVALSGIKRIILVAGTRGNGLAYASVTGPHDTIRVDIKQDITTENYRHENGHLLDAAECGFPQMYTDPGFAALNGTTELYSSTQAGNDAISWSMYLDDAESYEALEKRNRGNFTLSCGLVRADNIEASKVISYSDYHPNIVEDKAETIKNLPDQYTWGVLDNKRYPALYQKFRYELARLYQRAPKVAEYFAAIGLRPQPEALAPLDEIC